jgi:hypothetical protein
MLPILTGWDGVGDLADEPANTGCIDGVNRIQKEVDMKRLILFTLLGGLSLATPAQTPEDSEVRIRGYQIELPAHPHFMFGGDFDEYTGWYELSNGAVMTLSRNGSQMYAQIGNGERKELVAAKSNVFVALDRGLKITLDSDYAGEVLMKVPDRSAQANAGQIIRLASSR